MTYNVLMGTLNPTHSLTHVVFVETAPSFEQISQSINDLLTGSTAAADAADGGDDDDNDTAAESNETFTGAALSAEYQQISTWCWVNIRVRSCVLLQSILCNFCTVENSLV